MPLIVQTVNRSACKESMLQQATDEVYALFISSELRMKHPNTTYMENKSNWKLQEYLH